MALVVLGILLDAVLQPFQFRFELRERQEVNETLNLARNAIVSYAIVNRTQKRTLTYYDGVSYDIPAGRPYLPCPDIDNDGNEDRTKNFSLTTVSAAMLTTSMVCEESKGLLPWRTLGMCRQTDPWGNRIGYRVDIAFSSGMLGFDETFRADMFDPRLSLSLSDTDYLYSHRGTWHETGALICNSVSMNTDCPQQDLNNLLVGLVHTGTEKLKLEARIIPKYDTTDKNGSPTGVVNGAAFVIFSHGRNGYGAVGVNGKCRSVPMVADNLAEFANAYYRDGHPFINTATIGVRGCEKITVSTLAENIFVQAPSSSGKIDGSDDIVSWMSPNEIIGELLSAGVLPITKLEFLPD